MATDTADESILTPERRGRVIIVGYGDPHKRILAQALRARFASEVAACPSGEALLTEYTRTLRGNTPPGVIILETNMPVMNGINTALCVRSLERGAHLKPVTPILFFTNRDLDDTFRKVIHFVAPAKYLPMGDIAEEPFSTKVAQVADLLAKEPWTS